MDGKIDITDDYMFCVAVESCPYSAPELKDGWIEDFVTPCVTIFTVKNVTNKQIDE